MCIQHVMKKKKPKTLRGHQTYQWNFKTYHRKRQTLIEVCLSSQRSESLSQVYTVNRKPIWRLPRFRFPALINPIFTMPGCVQYGYISNTEIVK